MLRISYLLLLLCSLLFPSWVYSSDWSKKHQITTILDQKMRQDGIPGLSISIIRDGKRWWSTGMGLADIEHAIPATEDTLYRAGSLVKPLTATLILQLVEQGLLDPDNAAWEYCQAFPPKAHKVSIRQLLSHTSGLRTYNMPWSQYEKELFSKKRYQSVTDAISIFADDELADAPGTRYRYTSYGFNLLGCVIESIAESTYMEVLDKNILGPSEMYSTVVDRAEEIIPQRASHYRRDRKGRLKHEQYVDMTNKIPSGGLLSSVEDMAYFAQNYMAGGLLSKQSMQYAHKPAALNDGSEVTYGSGWELPGYTVNESSNEIFHSGLTPGATSIMYLYPEQQDAIVMMSNVYGVEDRVKLVKQIAEVLRQ